MYRLIVLYIMTTTAKELRRYLFDNNVDIKIEGIFYSNSDARKVLFNLNQDDKVNFELMAVVDVARLRIALESLFYNSRDKMLIVDNEYERKINILSKSIDKAEEIVSEKGINIFTDKEIVELFKKVFK